MRSSGSLVARVNPMVNLRLVLACAALGLVGLGSMPVASAAEIPLPAGVTVGDRDGDGLPEAHASAGTPPCLCYCPVVGAGAEVEAAGQEVYAVAIDGLCSYGAAADVDPNAVEPLGPASVDPFLICGGSLQAALCGSLNGAIAVATPTLDAAAAQVAPLPCKTYLQDRDGDGELEAWNVCSTPTCGCMCPVVGAGVVVEAAEQERGAWVATSGCQTAYGTMVDDADGGPVAKPFVWTWGLPVIVSN